MQFPDLKTKNRKQNMFPTLQQEEEITQEAEFFFKAKQEAEAQQKNCVFVQQTKQTNYSGPLSTSNKYLKYFISQPKRRWMQSKRQAPYLPAKRQSTRGEQRSAKRISVSL